MKFETEALRSELYEIGMTERAVIPIIDAIQNNMPRKAKQLMLLRRSDMLDELHVKQDRLYRLDCILKELP